MLEVFFSYSDTGLALLRIIVAIIFIYHGIPKLKNPNGLAGATGLPVWFGFLLGCVEVVGGGMLALNFNIQFVALALSLVMLGAIYFKIFKWKVPFYAHNSTGWEFDLIIFGVLLFFLTNLG